MLIAIILQAFMFLIYKCSVLWIDVIDICYPVQLRGITQQHDDVIKWKHFLRNWAFIRGIAYIMVCSSQSLIGW